MPRPKNETNIKDEQDLIELGRADLVSFSRWPLGYQGPSALWNCQKEWQEKIQEAYEARLADTVGGRHLCLLAPSEHGKTYGMDIPFILWALARNRNLRIGVVGSKDDLAANLGHGIDRLFKRRGDDLAKFGLIPGYPWNAYDKFLVRDDDKVIHPSITFLGPDTEVQGVRFDIIFLTDFATFKNQRTVESRRKLLDVIDHTIFPRLEPWGFVVAEGHHVHAEDIYTEFEERYEEWKILKYKAIIEEPSQENNGKAKLLAPEQWTFKQLDRIRARRPGVFKLIYQNYPIQQSGMVSRDLLDQCLDRSRTLQTHGAPEVVNAYERIVIGVDPAFTIKRYSSYSVCLVWGIYANGARKDLLAGWRLKILPPILRTKIVSTIFAWNPDAVFIEANAAQVFFVQEVQARLGKKADVVKPVYSLGNQPDNSVEQLMGECVSQCEAKLVTFPYLGEDARSLVDQLFNELVNFPECQTKDVAMAWNIMENGLKSTDESVRKSHKAPGFGRRNNARHVAAEQDRKRLEAEAKLQESKKNGA